MLYWSEKTYNNICAFHIAPWCGNIQCFFKFIPYEDNEYHHCIQTISWLLMTRQWREPRHQQPSSSWILSISIIRLTHSGQGNQQEFFIYFIYFHIHIYPCNNWTYIWYIHISIQSLSWMQDINHITWVNLISWFHSRMHSISYLFFPWH